MLKIIFGAVLIMLAFVGVMSIANKLAEHFLKFTQPKKVIVVVPVYDNDQNLEYTVRSLIDDMSGKKNTYTDICLLNINANETTKQIMEILSREYESVFIADENTISHQIVSFLDLQTL